MLPLTADNVRNGSEITLGAVLFWWHMAEKWIQGARESMEKRGTVGKFGKATASKVAAAKREGGTREKEAVFAQNMKRVAAKRKERRSRSR